MASKASKESEGSKATVASKVSKTKFNDLVFRIVDGEADIEQGTIDDITVTGPKLLVIDIEECANDVYPITLRFESNKTGKAIMNHIIEAIKALKQKSLCKGLAGSPSFIIKNEVQSTRYMCITVSPHKN